MARRIEELLRKHRKTWADLGRHLGVTDQTMTNWKTRGVPAGRYPELAAAFGLSIDDFLGVKPLPGLPVSWWATQTPENATIDRPSPNAEESTINVGATDHRTAFLVPDTPPLYEMARQVSQLSSAATGPRQTATRALLHYLVDHPDEWKEVAKELRDLRKTPPTED